MLGDMGQGVWWKRARLCPCKNADSGAADPACPVCHGVGWSWGEPIIAHTGLASMQVARQWAHFGQYESGDVVLSVPSNSPLYDAGESDQVVMTDSQHPYVATFTRGAPDERWPAFVFKVSEVFTVDGSVVTPRSHPSLADWRAGGVPAWGAGNVPAPGQQYSIRAFRRPIYFVFASLPQDRAHHGGLPLPRRIAARKFDLFSK